MKGSLLLAVCALALLNRAALAQDDDDAPAKPDVPAIAVPAGPAVPVGPAVPARPVPAQPVAGRPMPIQTVPLAPMPQPGTMPPAAVPGTMPQPPMAGPGETSLATRAAINLLNLPLRTGHEPTPEDAVRNFVYALNRADFNSACALLLGGDYDDKAKKEAEILSVQAQAHLLLVGDLRTYGSATDKRRATVTFSLTDVTPPAPPPVPGQILQNGAAMLPAGAEAGAPAIADAPDAAPPPGGAADLAAPTAAFPVTVERLHLYADRDGWLIVADAPLRPGFIRNREEDTLAYTVSLLVGKDPGAIAKMQRDMEVCQANLKALGHAAEQYLQDTAGDFGFKAADFRAALLPYIKDDAILNCPLVTVGDDSYAFNPNLQDVPYKIITHPEQTVLFYEGANMKLDFRHDGKANVCFADGHVSYLRPEEEAQLKWKP